MNRQQIAQIYDEFPESQQDMPKEQFIKETLSALNPDRIAAEAHKIVRQRMTGRMNQAAIDRALRNG